MVDSFTYNMRRQSSFVIERKKVKKNVCMRVTLSHCIVQTSEVTKTDVNSDVKIIVRTIIPCERSIGEFYLL